MKTKISITLEDSLLTQLDGLVDNLSIRNRSQAIEHLVRKGLGEKRVAVILAGGPEENIALGNGQYRITASVADSTVIGRVLKKLSQHKFREVHIVARQKVLTAIFELVKDGSAFDVSVKYIEETAGNGTADTLRLVKGRVRGSFLAVYGHILFDKINLEELWQSHLAGNSVATLLLTTAASASEKGSVRMEGERILEFVQKPKQSESHLVFSPIFVAEPELLSYTGVSLEYDIFPKLAAQGLLFGHISSEREQHVHSAADLLSLTG